MSTATVIVVRLDERERPQVPSRVVRCVQCDAECWLSLGTQATVEADGHALEPVCEPCHGPFSLADVELPRGEQLRELLAALREGRDG